MFQLVAPTPIPESTTLEDDRLCQTCQSLFGPEVVDLLLNTTIDSEVSVVGKQHLLCSEVLISSRNCYLCRWIVEISYFHSHISGRRKLLYFANPDDFAGNSSDQRITIRWYTNGKGVFSMLMGSQETGPKSISLTGEIRLGRMVGTFHGACSVVKARFLVLINILAGLDPLTS